MTKSTCLWLKGLPRLKSTKIVRAEFIKMKNNKRMSRLHYESFKLSPYDRAKARSQTFKGVAEAMAKQWGSLKNVYGFGL